MTERPARRTRIEPIIAVATARARAQPSPIFDSTQKKVAISANAIKPKIARNLIVANATGVQDEADRAVLSSSMSLTDLSSDYWKKINEMAPTIATVRGVHDYDTELPTFDDDELGDLASALRNVRDRAGELDESRMTTQDKITRSLLVHQCESALDTIETPFLLASIDPFTGPHTRLLSDTRQNTVSDASQADDLLERYAKVPGFLEGAIRTQRRCSAEGMTPAMAPLRRVMSQLDGYLASDLDDDPFLVLSVPGGGDGWRVKAEKLVTETIRPAFAEYRAALSEHIAPTARTHDKVGLSWIPNGEEIYSRLIKKYTQLDETAQAIHDVGQEWATGINAEEWVSIGNRAFGVDSLEGVFERLHSDPDLRFGSEEHMLDHARQALDRAWDAVDAWFSSRPATPCQVVPVPAAVAPAMPPAYYSQPPVDGSRPGTYFLNTYEPEQRDLFEYESIHFHEGIPGHHFDRSLAAELEGIPTFRRYAMVYAHTEGWGLYSERLADEMGLYSNETDRLGMVSADAWRAGRLVTDTGMHALGWSRQKAIDFLRKWTPIGLLTVEQEIDRYIGMPGQALAYKMGQLEILRLRDESSTRLGSDFDIKGFHDTMLVNGAMTLPMLTTAVDDWVSSIS